MDPLVDLDGIIEKIRVLEADKKRLAGALKGLPDLTWSTEKIPLGDITIGGEDGGVTKKTTHLFDFVFLRAVAVLFEYRKGKLSDVRYYPSVSPAPEMTYSADPLSEIEFRMFWSLRRLKKEIGTSIRAVEKFSPDIFLVDGSLTIHPGDVPRKESSLYEDYIEVKRQVKELEDACRKRKCLLAGIVEDSRSRIFCDYLKSEALPKTGDPKTAKKLSELEGVLSRVKDTNLLYYLLEKGQATKEIECGEGIHCFYLRTAEFDRPIRVEHMNPDMSKKLADIIFTLSCESHTYGLPNVLIEADQRAKLSEADSMHYISHIASKIGVPEVFFLRREGRPF
ncbi:MAG: DNA double-strand break repair nuclease NurA [Candidatus Aenigmatarchaeota archaeon]